MVYSPSVGAGPAPTASPFISSLPGVSEGFLSTKGVAGTVLVSIVTLLLLEQAYWRWRKGSLPGHKWQIVRSSPFHVAIRKAESV